MGFDWIDPATLAASAGSTSRVDTVTETNTEFELLLPFNFPFYRC